MSSFFLIARAILLVTCFFPVAGFGAHNPLLPRPQQVEYRSGTVPLRGLQIAFAGTPAAEDRFTATELVRVVQARTGLTLRISDGTLQSNARAIIIQRTGPVDALPVRNEFPGPDSRESYRLDIHSSGIRIQARSSAGAYYGVQTLAQLIEGAGTKAVLPFVEIHDWPALSYRAAMVDMSEGQLATEQEVLRQIDLLARWKANQYFFYTEDSIELDGYPLLNSGAKFSKAQVRRIIEYGRKRHVDIVPCLELYGHQHDLFRIERYSRLADFPHGGEFDPKNPEIRSLLDNWIDQYLQLFPSQFVHIGFDETWEIARAAREKGAQSTPAKLFVEQARMVANRFAAHGKFVMAWGDIMVKYPDIISQLPSGLAAVPWWYEPDPDPEYKHWLDPLVAHGVPTFVAPGISMWNQIAPDFAKSFRNIDTFLAAGKRAHTLGLVNTFWTDNQQILRRMGWPGMAYGAAAAWQTSAMQPANFFSEFAEITFGSETGPRIARALDALSRSELELQKAWGAATMSQLWQNPFALKFWNVLEAHQEELRQTRLLAEDAQENFSAALAVGADPTMLKSMLFGSRLLDYAGMKGLYAIEIGKLWQKQKAANGIDQELWELLSGAFSNTHGRLGDLMDSLSDLRPLYKENWLAEYTPYRLETALLRWQMEHEFWWRVQQRFRRFRAAYKEGQPMPDLDAVVGEYD